jgi:hypothetical protein
MTKKINTTLIHMPGFVAAGSDINLSPKSTVLGSSEMVTPSTQDVLHEAARAMVLESMVLLDDDLLSDVPMFLDQDIPERVGLRAFLARAVC